MTDPNPQKPQYPSASGEIGRLLHMEPGDYVPGQVYDAKAPAPAGLPIGTNEDAEMAPPAEKTTPHDHEESSQMAESIIDVTAAEEEMEKKQKKTSKITKDKALRMAKKIAPYVAVFVIGLLIYNFYASDFSWSSIFKSSPKAATVQKSNPALEALKKQEATNYNAWIKQFFVQSDASVSGMGVDVSGNGLTNFQKYLLNLNPKVYDTLGNNVGDGQQVINYINPWTGLAMTDDQKKLVDTYFDKELISNRITAAQASHSNDKFASLVTSDSPYFVDTTKPVTSAPAQTATVAERVAPATGADNAFGQGLDIDTSIPGHLDVPNQFTVPLIWSTSPDNFDRDLASGIIHYTGTPLPGEIGTSYISGHSSGYFWNKSQYKDIFAKLGNVKDGTSFTIAVTLKDGKLATLHYVVGGRAEYKADDPRQFIQTSKSIVALSTCWPVNTTARRLVLFAALTQVEK